MSRPTTLASGEAAAIARTSWHAQPHPGHQYLANHGPSICQPFQKRRCGYPFLPRSITGLVSFFPIHCADSKVKPIHEARALVTARSKKRFDQETDSRQANHQAGQPKSSTPDQHRDRPDCDGDLKHGHTARQYLMGAQVGLRLFLQIFGLFCDLLLLPLIGRLLLLIGTRDRLPRASRISALLVSAVSLMLLD